MTPHARQTCGALACVRPPGHHGPCQDVRELDEADAADAAAEGRAEATAQAGAVASAASWRARRPGG